MKKYLYIVLALIISFNFFQNCGQFNPSNESLSSASEEGSNNFQISSLNPSARISGSVVGVFNYPQQSCMPLLPSGELGDRADMAARAFIDDKNKIQFYSGYFDMYRMTGTSLGKLTRVCGTNGNAAVLVSPDDPVYGNHRSREWLQAFYTRDGKNVSAIASVDWNGFWYSNQSICKNLRSTPAGNIRCWWNKLTSFESRNGGLSFEPKGSVQKNQAVALPPGDPSSNADNGGRYGYFHVTNILKDPKTGHYYFFTLVTGSKTNNTNNQKDGICLMRAWKTADLSNPNSWHSWSGGSKITHPRLQTACETIKMPPHMGNARFLGYSTYFKKYILFSGQSDGTGLYFSLSDRLDQWSGPSYKIPFYEGKQLFYISLIDPNYSNIVQSLDESTEAKSERRNFDIIGQNPWVFFVEKTQSGNPILKRVGIKFSQ